MSRKDRQHLDLHIGVQLRKLRKHCDMSQRDLGELLGMSCQQIQKYEAAKNSFDAALLFQISELFEVSIYYFFDGLES